MFWQLSLAVLRPDRSSPDADIDAAIQEATTAIAIMRTAYGSNLQCSRYLSWVVGVCMAHGRTARARTLLDEALQLAGESGERYWGSELCRLDALVRQAEGADTNDVSRFLREALATAEAQGAGAFALRAAVTLRRALHAQGQTDEARGLVAPWLEAIDDEVGSPDLEAARELLPLTPAPPA